MTSSRRSWSYFLEIYFDNEFLCPTTAAISALATGGERTSFASRLLQVGQDILLGSTLDLGTKLDHLVSQAGGFLEIHAGRRRGHILLHGCYHAHDF